MTDVETLTLEEVERLEQLVLRVPDCSEYFEIKSTTIKALVRLARAHIEAREGDVEGVVSDLKNIVPYLDFTIGSESPGYHPTMPSAVANFKHNLGVVADALTALRAERDKLATYFREEAPTDGFEGDVEGLSPVDMAIRVMRRGAALKADNERLRGALTSIAKTPPKPFLDAEAHSWRAFGLAVHRAWLDIQRIARAALGRGGDHG